MGQEMECMCMECGTSMHIGLESISLDESGAPDMKLLTNYLCTECGGQLMLRGKAGDEPHYKTG